VIRIDRGCRVDLQCIVVVRGVFEETIRWIENLVAEEEKPLSVGQLATQLT
jgi:hypothetical protein